MFKLIFSRQTQPNIYTVVLGVHTPRECVPEVGGKSRGLALFWGGVSAWDQVKCLTLTRPRPRQRSPVSSFHNHGEGLY